MEPNAVPGFTNRSIARLVARALVSFPETAAFFPRGRTEVTGLPVREEFFQIQPKPRGPVLQLLITGGSQGSRTLNHAARQSWPLFRKAGFPVRITHQTGPAASPKSATPSPQSGLEGEVVPFISDMPAAFAEADLVVCRVRRGSRVRTRGGGQAVDSGSVPLCRRRSPDAQRARPWSAAGAARLVRDAEMTGEKLFETVEPNYRGAGRAWGEAARQFARARRGTCAPPTF